MPVGQHNTKGQLRPDSTSAQSLYTPDLSGTDDLRVDTVTSIVACNPTTSSVKYSIYLDFTGSTFDATTVLFNDIILPPNTTDVIAFGGILSSVSGNIGVKVDTADSAVFTFFGDHT
jgi:hypothetical protein